MGLITMGLSALGFTASAQDNSPYSRYGIGDLVPPTGVTSRSMGGLAAGYFDFLSINYSNPATYSTFQSYVEPKNKKKMGSGRSIFDVGMNFESRVLREQNNPVKFTASNALFSHAMLGVPIKPNWGLAFGLRPVSRISYNIAKRERLYDPQTGLMIDSSLTTYQGDGGAYIASIGTGKTIFKKEIAKADHREAQFSVGFNAGYLFGNKEYHTRRSIINDTVTYESANYESKTNYGNLYFDAGFQYRLPIKKLYLFTLGAFGNWSQTMKGTQDKIRETYVYSDQVGNIRLDSVSDIRNQKGNVVLPSNFTVGFTMQKLVVLNKEGGWLFGVDFNNQKWSQYKFYGQTDSVRNSWQIRVGAQISPVPKRTYWSFVNYRFGFYTGPEYINAGGNMNSWATSFGLGLPLLGRNSSAVNQTTRVNIGVEYGKRGSASNLLRENNFRFSIGLSLSDAWFIKRKYE